MEKKLTLKEKVLRFVEEKEVARFIDIQEFIVDLKYGKGSYKNGQVHEPYEYVWDALTLKNKPTKYRWTNLYRGIFCGAFYSYGNYFMHGPDYLKRISRGKYVVVRNKSKVKEAKPNAKVEPKQDSSNNFGFVGTGGAGLLNSHPSVIDHGTRRSTEKCEQHVHDIKVAEEIDDLLYLDIMASYGYYPAHDIKPIEGVKLIDERIKEQNAFYEIRITELDKSLALKDAKIKDLEYQIDQQDVLIHDLNHINKSEQPKYCRWCGHTL